MSSTTLTPTDAGALPAALSDLLFDLRRTGLVDGCVTAGHAFGGDVEAVNVRSGLQLARWRLGDGSVLDHSLLMYGSGMANSNLHNCDPVPAVLLGKVVRYEYPDGTVRPTSDLVVRGEVLRIDDCFLGLERKLIEILGLTSH